MRKVFFSRIIFIKVLISWICLNTFNLSAINNYFSKNEPINIRIFAGIKISEADLTASGNYSLVNKEKNIGNFSANESVKLKLHQGKIQVIEKNIVKHSYTQINIKTANDNSTINIKILGNKERKFQGLITVTVKDSFLFFVNSLPLESYVAGVVESEAGVKNNLEYSKVQSIICRTYAHANRNKHKTEGFHLCDMVHCQVYNGACTNSDIIEATKQTEGLVVVDSNNRIISAAFHSNCGGRTVNSEDVWSNPLSYLKAVDDTFCLNMPNAKWEKKVALTTWLDNLNKKYNYDIMDILLMRTALNYTQFERKIYFNDNPNVKLRNLRTDFELKSTYFSVKQVSDSVLLSGKGYGHGVGLCQEGAMRMSQLGKSYIDILNFYYKNTKVVSIKDIVK